MGRGDGCTAQLDAAELLLRPRPVVDYTREESELQSALVEFKRLLTSGRRLELRGDRKLLDSEESFQRIVDYLARSQVREHLRYSRESFRELWLALQLSGGADPDVVACYDPHSKLFPRAVLHVRDGCERLSDGVTRAALRGEWWEWPELRCSECAGSTHPALSGPQPLLSSAFQKRLELGLSAKLKPWIAEALEMRESIRDLHLDEGIEFELLNKAQGKWEFANEHQANYLLDVVRHTTSLWVGADPEKALQRLIGDEYPERLRQAKRECPVHPPQAVVRTSVNRSLNKMFNSEARIVWSEKFGTEPWIGHEVSLWEYDAEKIRRDFLKEVCYTINRIGQRPFVSDHEVNQRSGLDYQSGLI